MSNYRIRRTGDEEYLQHWSLGGAHKYIAKIDLGGKFRYFYNQAEIDAYKNALKNAGNAIGDAAKNTYKVVRKGMDDAGRQISTWKRKAEKAVGNAYENAQVALNPSVRAAKEKYESAKRKYRASQETVSNVIKNDMKYPPEQRWDKKIWSNHAGKNYRRMKAAEQAYKKALSDSTPIGAAKNLAKKASDTIGITAKKRYDKASDMADKAKKKSDIYYNRVNNLAAKYGPDKAYKSKSAEAFQKAFDVEKSSRKVADRAKESYSKTPLAKAERTFNDTRDNINNMVKDAKNAAGYAVKRASNAANNVGNAISNWVSPKAPTPKLSSPNPKVIKENVIKENVIKEKKLPEKILREKTIKEERIPEKVLRDASSRTSKEYRQESSYNSKKNSSGGSGSSSSKTRTTNNFDPSGPKPEGVSQEYWDEYRANSGYSVERKKTNTSNTNRSGSTSKEYQQESAYNSKKNSSSSTTSASARKSKAQALRNSGKTYAQIAKQLGVSVSYVSNLLNS